MSTPTLIEHRPHGIEHPYAASPDQRVPVQPQMGEAVVLGVQASTELASLTCEWRPTTGEATVLTLAPRAVNASDAAALSGGEGHLAAAQASSLGGSGGWATRTPPVNAAVDYRFLATTPSGHHHTTDWYSVHPAKWVTAPAAGMTATLTGADARLVDGTVEWLVSAQGIHRVRFALKLSAGDHVVGFGERFDHLDQRGHRLDAVVFEQYKAQGRHGRTYLPMPFAHVVGDDGTSWGFHIRTTRRSWYDVAASNPDHLVIEVELGGTDRADLDVGLYDGDPTAVLRSFLNEAGRAEELPSWVFRLWASGNEWNTQALVTERMDTHRELDIPVGVVVIEAWSDEEGIMIFRDATYAPHPDGSPFALADFEFPPEGAWPDPRAMVEDLHARGIKVLLWQIPLVKTAASEEGLHAQVLAEAHTMVEHDHAVREADGSPYLNRGWWFPKSLMPDLSVQRTRDWWTAKRDYLVRDLDVDGFKTDGGEHAWGHDLRYADGRAGDEGNNLYPVHYARAFGDLLRKHGKAPITFSRSGFTGSQAHGIHWAGDEDSTWEAFRNSVTAGITVASCGVVYWGWDIAGFSGEVPDAELYLRATAASTFMPIMQYHSEFNHHQRPLRDRTPWFVAEANGDPDVVDIFRRYAELRERLVPYLAEQARKAIETDRPLMRGLFFDWPDEPAVWEWPGQFLLGNDLLIHPVTQPAVTVWSSFLPVGRWVDVWTGVSHEGGQVVERSVPRDVLPVYCRAERWEQLRPVFSTAGGSTL